MNSALPLVVSFGAVMAESMLLFTVIKLLGAGYLVYLGVQAFRIAANMLNGNGVKTVLAQIGPVEIEV